MSKGVKQLTDVLKLISTRSGAGYDSWFPDKIKVISAGEGNFVCEVTVDKDMINIHNTMHGGCTASIVDMISSAALLTSSKPFPGVSVDLSVSYMSGAKLGEDLIIDAKTLKVGGTLAFLTAKIVSAGDGCCVCELTVDEQMANASGNLHGGCTASIVDLVSTLALISSPSDSLPGVSVELNVSYISAASLGNDIIVDAQTLKVGKNLAFLLVTIKRKSDGVLVAVGKHTKFVRNDALGGQTRVKDLFKSNL
ncbi:hypothetical protein CHUAL_005624 [Chamberlinius hualienensis]